jgi:hypothetical protein
MKFPIVAVLAFALPLMGMAQTLSVAVTAIPAGVTRVGVLVDGGAATSVLRSFQPLTPGVTSTTLTLSVPAGSGYRVRAFGDSALALLASGKATGVTAATGASTPVSIALSAVSAAFDAQTPLSAVAGSPLAISFTAMDPGDVLEEQTASLYVSGSSFLLPGASVFTSKPVVRGVGGYTAVFSINAPVSGTALYYAARVTAAYGDTSTAIQLPSSGAARSMGLTGTANLSITISNIPSTAAKLGVLVDGGSVQGTLWGVQTVSNPAASLVLPVRVPAGGPYRVRVLAAGANGLLRSAKASGVNVPSSGSVSATVALANVSVTAGSGTPSQAVAGSVVALGFNVTDPGEVLEGGTALLYCAPAAFTDLQTATRCATGTLAPLYDGAYWATTAANLESASGSWHYVLRVHAGAGDAGTFLNSGFQAISLTGTRLNVSLRDVPALATAVSVIVDGPGVSVPVEIRQAATGASSLAVALTVPAGAGYRVRAMAYDANGLLRSAKVAAATASANAPEVVIPLRDITVSAGSSTPVSIAAGSFVQLQFNIADPGDVLENATAALFYGSGSFALPAGTHLASLAVNRTGDGLYAVSYTGTLPTASSTFHYALRVRLGDVTTLNFPAAGVPAWQIQVGAECSYTVQPASLSVPAAGASGTISITASSSTCPWNLHTTTGWITASPVATASGPGTVSYTVSANTGDARTAAIRVGAQTVLISQSEPSAVPGDFDENGVPDLVWQHDGTRHVGTWYLGGPDAANVLDIRMQVTETFPGWKVVTIADMDGNGVPDLVWQHDGTREVGVWYMGGPHGTVRQSMGWPAPGSYPGWTLVGIADMNRDGVHDLVWQNDVSRQVGVWYMGGTKGNTLSFIDWPAPDSYAGWRVVAVADMNRDGVPDLVWQHDATRQAGAWYMSGPRGTTRLYIEWPAPGEYPGWRIVGIADMNRDGVPDLIWQHDVSRAAGTWLMGGTRSTDLVRVVFQAPDSYAGWRVVGPK